MQYEKRYRQAVMSESIVVYQVNFSKDLIEEEFSQRTEDDEEVKVLSAVSLHAPCSYNEYCLRWSRRVADDCMSAYRRLDTCEKLLKIYARGITSASIEYRTRDATEKGIWVNKTVQMMEDEETKDILGLVCLKDITKQREKEIYAREMRKKATMDLMTGLLNHVSGEMAIRERLLSRQDQEYALFVFDVDEFKSINDRRGHQFGDAVLKKTADILLSVCRMKDVAVRMGGDEFVLMGVYSPKSDVVKRIETEMLERLKQLNMESDLPFTVSFSYGVYWDHPSNSLELKHCMRIADANMYEMKTKNKELWQQQIMLL